MGRLENRGLHRYCCIRTCAGTAWACVLLTLTEVPTYMYKDSEVFLLPSKHWLRGLKERRLGSRLILATALPPAPSRDQHLSAHSLITAGLQSTVHVLQHDERLFAFNCQPTYVQLPLGLWERRALVSSACRSVLATLALRTAGASSPLPPPGCFAIGCGRCQCSTPRRRRCGWILPLQMYMAQLP